MKTLKKTLLFIGLVLLLSILPIQAGIAVGAQSDDKNGAAATSSEVRARSIPDSFNVNKYLNTDGQTKLVPTEDAVGTADNEGKAAGIAAVLIKFIDLLVKLIGSVALVVFIIGALMTIVSEGKEDRLEKGKSAMLYSIYGLLFAFMSFIIVAFVQSVLF